VHGPTGVIAHEPLLRLAYLGQVTPGSADSFSWRQRRGVAGRHPMACTAVSATLDVIREEGLLENARVQGAHIMDALLDLQAESPLIGDVRGVGLMIAVEFIKPNEVGPPALPTRSQTPRPSAGSWSAVWQMAC